MGEPRGSRLYGRAIGKTLRKEPRRLIAETLPNLAVPTDGALAPVALFAKPMADLWLEIGFGGGEHLVGMAAAHPDIGFLGCEPFVNGVAKALAGIETGALANVRIHAGDAMELVERLPEASIGRLFVLFPDPWPKRRHNKRRVISDESLAQFARVLRPSGAIAVRQRHRRLCRLDAGARLALRRLCLEAGALADPLAGFARHKIPAKGDPRRTPPCLPTFERRADA